MRVTIISTGSVGDTQPFIALGKKLKQVGFKVLFAGPENVRKTCHAHELEFLAIDIDTQTRLRRETQKIKLESGGTLGFLLQRMRARREIALQVNRSAWLASQKSDLIVYRIGGYLLGNFIAEKLGVPCIKAGLVPYTPTRQFPSLYIPKVNNLGSFGNLLSYYTAGFGIWQFMRKMVEEFRTEILGLNAYSWKISADNPFLHIHKPGAPPLLYAFSPSLLPKPVDWSQNIHVTGHWHLETSQNWQPDVSLLKFLDQSPPPIYMGFGSMISHSTEKILKIYKEALNITGQRGILAGGWNKATENVSADNNLYYLESAPHDWLFQHVSMAIHHGGIGTTISSLKAGLPTIVVPFNYDQPFWGTRVFLSGAGPRPIPINQLTADNLARSVQSILTTHEYRTKANQIGLQIKSESGLEIAADLIRQVIS